MLKLEKVECPEFVEGHFFVYILECVDSSFYCGSTTDVGARLTEHSAGRAAKWTAKRIPIKLVYYERLDSLLSARRREKQIKGWTRKKKLHLIHGVLSKNKDEL